MLLSVDEREAQWAHVVKDVPDLTSGDGCEQPGCGAQAFVRTVFLIGYPRRGMRWTSIDWCAHHYTEHEDQIFLSPAYLGRIDVRHRINVKPDGRM